MLGAPSSSPPVPLAPPTPSPPQPPLSLPRALRHAPPTPLGASRRYIQKFPKHLLHWAAPPEVLRARTSPPAPPPKAARPQHALADHLSVVQGAGGGGGGGRSACARPAAARAQCPRRRLCDGQLPQMAMWAARLRGAVGGAAAPRPPAAACRLPRPRPRIHLGLHLGRRAPLPSMHPLHACPSSAPCPTLCLGDSSGAIRSKPHQTDLRRERAVATVAVASCAACITGCKQHRLTRACPATSACIRGAGHANWSCSIRSTSATSATPLLARARHHVCPLPPPSGQLCMVGAVNALSRVRVGFWSNCIKITGSLTAHPQCSGPREARCAVVQPRDKHDRGMQHRPRAHALLRATRVATGRLLWALA